MTDLAASRDVSEGGIFHFPTPASGYATVKKINKASRAVGTGPYFAKQEQREADSKSQSDPGLNPERPRLGCVQRLTEEKQRIRREKRRVAHHQGTSIDAAHR